MDNKFKFGELKENIRRMKEELPAVLANQAMNYFVSSWDKQAWNGVPWETPKRKIEGTSEYKYPKFADLGRRTRATLVKSGRLRRSVSMSIRSQTFTSIRLRVDLPYSKAHNDGAPDKGIPQRQFIGQTPELTQAQQEKIRQFMGGLWGK